VADQLRRLKMSNKVKRLKAVKLVAAFYAQEKKVHTESEYVSLGNRQPVTGSTIKYIFGGYAGLMTMIKQSAFWGNLEQYSKVTPTKKPEAEKPTVQAPKPAPKAAVKPAPKVAVKVEKEDE